MHYRSEQMEASYLLLPRLSWHGWSQVSSLLHSPPSGQWRAAFLGGGAPSLSRDLKAQILGTVAPQPPSCISICDQHGPMSCSIDDFSVDWNPCFCLVHGVISTCCLSPWATYMVWAMRVEMLVNKELGSGPGGRQDDGGAGCGLFMYFIIIL